MLDTSTAVGAAAARRLETELIVWLTTVSPAGQPQSSPVWFLWDDGEFLVYSLAVTPRIRNIRANRRVSLNLNSDATASDVVTVEGEARIVPDAPLPSGVPALIDKYRHLIEEYGWTVDEYAADYPTAIRIRPTRFRFG
jgi:PPOX class probable F420-dependent enzyme